jgi:hypothetical protein
MQAPAIAIQVPLARDLVVAGIAVSVHSQLEVEVGNSV